MEASVPPHLDNERLDQVAAELFGQYSRSRLQKWIKGGELTVDGQVLRTRDKVSEGQRLVLCAEPDMQETDSVAQPMPLDIVFEDDSLLVLNKPAGLVVHPAAGHSDNTLLNGLLHHCPQLSGLPRAGIVHRLDKDTTGLMVVAKTLAAHHSLVAQLQERSVSRQYYALVQGVMTAGGTVDAPIGRHPSNRQKQAVTEFGGKEAVTHYRVVSRFRAHTLVRCQLETGRTHQIRVHMAHIRFPLLGDRLYGGKPKLPKAASQALIEGLQQFPRQALHAFKLGLWHPEDDEYCEWEIAMAADMQALVALLKDDLREHTL
ncbi:MAG TPA: 23S rRNA pseudouridine(1911/1915/1917) synthase RluD [Pseudomonadales bacterium]